MAGKKQKVLRINWEKIKKGYLLAYMKQGKICLSHQYPGNGIYLTPSHPQLPATAIGDSVSQIDFNRLFEKLDNISQSQISILRQTQSGFSHQEPTTSVLVKAKEYMISAKDKEVQVCMERIATFQSEVYRLRQENEDLRHMNNSLVKNRTDP